MHEFRRWACPRAVGVPFELALGIDPADGADRARLDEHGWRVVDPRIVADTSGFHRFVRTSGAEFSVAQGVYVETQSRWFGDRTVRYLASGRPARAGHGLRVSRSERARCLQQPGGGGERARRIGEDYERHRAAARQLAEEYFAPERALVPLLDAAEVAQ